jgi:hypothetical protein
LGAYAEAVKDGMTAQEGEKALAGAGNKPVNEDIVKEVNAMLGVDFKTVTPASGTTGTTTTTSGTTSGTAGTTTTSGTTTTTTSSTGTTTGTAPTP